MMSFLSRNMVVVVIVGVVVLGVLWYLFSDNESDAVLVSTPSELGAESIAEQGIVETLLALRAVSLSGTIFSDPAFRALVDFGTEIVPEPIGRPNPFAPRGAAPVDETNDDS